MQIRFGFMRDFEVLSFNRLETFCLLVCFLSFLNGFLDCIVAVWMFDTSVVLGVSHRLGLIKYSKLMIFSCDH